jgi:hypothetical protein
LAGSSNSILANWHFNRIASLNRGCGYRKQLPWGGKHPIASS